MRRGMFLFGVALAAACGTSNVNAPTDAGPFDATTDAPAPAPEGGADAGPDAAKVVVPKGARVLGLDINPAENGDFVQALKTAQTAGIEATNVSLNWDDIEVPADGGEVTYFTPYLHIANLVFPPSHVAVSLAIRPIDAKKSHVPADLGSKRLNDPQVIDRFNRLQDYVFGQIPDLSLATYLVGNEVEAFLGEDPAAWQDYTTFYEAVSAYARTKRMGLKVGVTASSLGYGQASSSRPRLGVLNASSDVIAVNYLPASPDFTVRPVTAVQADIEHLLSLFPTKPFYFRQAGFPSGALILSSEAAQAEFVGEMFRIWDLHRDRVPYVGFFTMNEYGPKTVDDAAAALGVTDSRFKEYLRTLGLRSFQDAGVDKPAFLALAREAHARGW